MEPCEICGRQGQRHHIVFRSQGGLNVWFNYAYLCAEHHTQSPDSVHRNRSFDLVLKIMLQRKLEDLFCEPEYTMVKIAEFAHKDRRRLSRRMKHVPDHCGKYRREDIIRFFMGGRLYADLRPEEESDGFQEIGTEGFIMLEDEDVLP